MKIKTNFNGQTERRGNMQWIQNYGKTYKLNMSSY